MPDKLDPEIIRRTNLILKEADTYSGVPANKAVKASLGIYAHLFVKGIEPLPEKSSNNESIDNPEQAE